MNYEDKYSYWLKNVKDEDLQKELLLMASDPEAVRDAFYTELEFGTAGLRGIMGAGTNRLNIYTVIKITEGICRCMKHKGYTLAAITYDSRNNSPLFAETAARVFASHDIETYITQECMPTPFLSYAVRRLKIDIGVNITASHNPSQYNGYKVYGSDGCQLTDDGALEMTGYIEKVDPFEVSLLSFEQGQAKGLIKFISDDLAREYSDKVFSEILNFADGLNVVYSPLNGAGYDVVPKLLKRCQTERLWVVEEQAYPDGNFPTCPYPNPEKAEALALAVKLAKEKNCDIVIANDPDCDRLGVAVRHNGDYVQLTGNEVGVILTDYIFSSLAEQGKLPEEPVLVKTIVTTPLAEKIAAEYGAKTSDVLTGFKYIGSAIGKLERSGKESSYVFGFEESCGYLKGTYVRDKDGAIAALLTAGAAAKLKKQNKTFVDRLNELYLKFGRYEHFVSNYRFDGADGAEKKEYLLKKLRRHGFEKIGASAVVETMDFTKLKKSDLPKADVIKFTAADGTQLIVRPSGTEPLIKAYLTVFGKESLNAEKAAAVKKQLDAFFA